MDTNLTVEQLADLHIRIDELVWGWMNRNLEKIIRYAIVPEQMKIGRGKIGKNMGASWGQEFHPDFLAYLETPHPIRLVGKKLRELSKRDKELYLFIILKSEGYSAKEIDAISDDIPEVNFRLIRGKRTRSPTNQYKKLRRKALLMFMECLPKHKLKAWKMDVVVPLLEETYRKNKRKDDARRGKFDRETCPKCQGTDISCTLCRTRSSKHEWDGTVQAWIARKYRAGEWIE